MSQQSIGARLGHKSKQLCVRYKYLIIATNGLLIWHNWYRKWRHTGIPSCYKKERNLKINHHSILVHLFHIVVSVFNTVGHRILFLFYFSLDETPCVTVCFFCTAITVPILISMLKITIWPMIDTGTYIFSLYVFLYCVRNLHYSNTTNIFAHLTWLSSESAQYAR